MTSPAGSTDPRALVLVWAIAAVNLAYAATLIVVGYAMQTPGVVDPADLPVPDFAAFWAAGRMALEGTPALAWDWDAHRAAEVAGVGYDFVGWMPWHYPPTFQLGMAPFAALPLWPAMAAWAGLTLGLFVWTCWRILPGALAPGAALAAAPTAMNLVNGQTGFLIAALMGLGLLALERRPAGAGLALGLLSVKPHLALAFPVALAAAGRWRVLAVAALAALGFAGLALAVLGPASWAAFVTSVTDTASVLRGAHRIASAPYEMGASPYMGLRVLDLGLRPALALQAVVSVAVLVVLARAWADPRLSPALKAALACFATVAATPRVLNYDLHILVVGGLFQLRHARNAGHFRGEAGILLAALVLAIPSMLYPPGVNWGLGTGLFLACWLGHARNSYRRVAAS